jgi:hypothetical protein
MSVVETDKIDAIGTDKVSGDIILTISDHLDWDDGLQHLEILQEKLNSYIEFIEGGQILEDYPNSIGKKMIIEIVSKFQYNEQGNDFIEKVKPIIQSIGADIRQRVSKSR